MVIVDKCRVAMESRPRCRTGMVDTSAAMSNTPRRRPGLTGRLTDPRHHVGQEDSLPREKVQTTSMPELPAAV